jgi:hypothetical protein
MLRSKATVFGMIAALVLMTGAFTALSSGEIERPVTASNADGFVVVNGHEVQESDYVTRVATVEQNMVMLSAEAENAPQSNPLADSLMDIMETTPAETIALASLILDKAIYHAAIDRGHLPDEDIVAQQVSQEREMFEMIEADPAQFGVEEAAVERYRDNIEDAGGEELYWNEFYPQIIEQQMAVQQFQMAVSQDGEDWIEIQRQAFENADVQIRDPEQVAPATVSEAGTYLNRVWDIYESQRTS